LKEYPYWLDTVLDSPGDWSINPATPVTGRVRTGSVTGVADVVIVGAGYTGLAAARELARQGASVLVLERERVGSGASARNGGQVLTGLKIGPETLIARYGETRARELFAAAEESIASLEAVISEESIQCGYQRTGHIQAAAKPKHFDAFRRERSILARTFGHDVELVSRSEQRTEVGSNVYHGLLFDPRSGALNPAQYVHGLAAAARRAGACVSEWNAVERVEREATAWRLIVKGAGAGQSDIRARDLLVATNGYTDEAFSGLRRRLVPIGSYIIVTEPLPASTAASILPRGRVAFDSKHFLCYFRITRDGRLAFGGRAEFSRPGTESARRAAAILSREMIRVFPELATIQVEYAWGGNVAFTRDQMPHGGQLGGIYYAGGYCGHGIAMATYLGQLVARRLAGQPIDSPLLRLPLPRVPLYRGRPWFLPLVGAYYRLLDWVG
jgi:glycine/D-amino acid oxidase-like deaminating enzyme